MGSEFDVVVRVLDGHALLAVKGDVDAYTGPNLIECLTAAVDESDGDVTLDMSGVSFIDSSGIAILVATAKQLRQRGNELVVDSPPRMVAKVMEMTGVTKLVRLEQSSR